MSDALNEALVEGGISRADTTLKALATRARDQISSQTVKVTPETFAPTGVAPMTIPAQPRRSLSPMAIGGVVVGGVIVIGIALVALQGLAPRGSAPPPVAQVATASPASSQVVTTPTAAGGATALSYVYDNFDNPAYDGSFNPSLWFVNYEYGCTPSQMQGWMVANNDPSPDKDVYCGLTVSRPTRVSPAEMGMLQARLKFNQTSAQGNSNTAMTIDGYYPTEQDLMWRAHCGLAADQRGVYAFFQIQNQNIGKPGDSVQDSAYREWWAEADHWYTIQMKLNPETMVITCLVDGQLLASVAPDNAVGVKSQLLDRVLDTWRSPLAASVSHFDDFIIVPPEVK
jgi:hypothetical protein